MVAFRPLIFHEAGKFRANAVRLGLAGLGVSVATTFAVAVAGVSVLEPALPGKAGQPPWAASAHISPYLAVGLTALALASGAFGLAVTLNAVRAGWRMPAHILLLAGIAAAAALTLVPPFGAADHLNYAVYGRMVVTGHNPYLTTPAQLARLGDPVARAVQDWTGQVSVYGPLASGVQALASLIGGTSTRLTVFGLGLVNLIAFAGAGLLLYRMTAARPDRQLRAVLLWTANPLLLQVLAAGAHVDTQAIALCVAAVAVFYGPWPGRPRAQVGAPRAVLAGVLVGCAFAVKVTGALIGLALAVALVQVAWPHRRRPQQAAWPQARRAIAGLAAGFGAVAAAAMALGGSGMLRAESSASDMVSIGSPWRVIRSGLQHTVGHHAAADVVKYGAVVLAVVLAVLIVRYGPRLFGESDGGVPLAAGCLLVAVTVGWLFAWPYVLPWYDALGWAFLALVPASNLDRLLLARTTALGFGYLPARNSVTLPHGLHWLQPVFRDGITPVVLAVTTGWLVVILLRAGKREPWRSS
jgi:hypothetical protein